MTELLLKAINNDNLQEIKTILDSDPSLLNGFTENGMTILAHVGRFGSKKALMLLLSYIDKVDVGAGPRIIDKPDLTGCNNCRMRPLTHAVIREDPERIILLLQHGANVNATHNGNETALCLAVYAKNIKVCKILVENGADITNEIITSSMVMSGCGELTNYLILKMTIPLYLHNACMTGKLSTVQKTLQIFQFTLKEIQTVLEWFKDLPNGYCEKHLVTDDYDQILELLKSFDEKIKSVE